MCLYLRLLELNSVVGGILLSITPFPFLKDNNLGLRDVFWGSVGHLRCLCSRKAIAEKSVGAARSLPGLTVPDGPTAARNVETHAVRTVDYPTSDTTSESLYIESRRP